MRNFIIALLIMCPMGSLIAGTNYQAKLDSSIKKLKNLTSDSIISESFYYVMTDSVFPHWMGTKWDFNGVSNVPGKGMIACGYFVSTTLKHVGFNLNRYRLAQQAASKVIDVLCGENKMKSVLEADIIQKLKSRGNNRLYVVGLDYHVGFLAVEKDSVYFIHSDYFNGKVVCEKASESPSFSNTNAYVYGELTNNTVLFNRWKNGIKVY